MTKISYVYPQGTKFANFTLDQIYKQSGAFRRQCEISKVLRPNQVNISWGYLGLYAWLSLCANTNQRNIAARSSFSLDHAFGPASLKRRIFRVARMDKTLTSIVFNQSLLNSSDIDSIYLHLKEISCQQTISFQSTPDLSAINLSAHRSISLLIKRSAVLARLKGKSDNITSTWLREMRPYFLHDKNKHFPIVSIKKNEPILTSSGEVKSRSVMTSQITIPYQHISEVVCPFSMFAIPFILHSTPVYLSEGHPLFPLLGSYIAPCSPSSAIDLVLDAIKRTSVSLDRFALLETYLHRYSRFSG